MSVTVEKGSTTLKSYSRIEDSVSKNTSSGKGTLEIQSGLESLSKKDKVLECGPLESMFPCSESKILDFLVTFQEYDYSISDIAEHSGIGFKTALEVVKDLEEQQVIVKTRNVGRALMYKLNLDSKHAQSINRLATDIAIRDVKENKKSNNNVKEAKCPKCGLIAHNQDEIKKRFGIRSRRGKQIVQSWCKECR